MKVLITGASGFLGSWFLDHFIRGGAHDTWQVDIVPHPSGLPVDQQDMVDWLSDFDEQVDIAFHFAAPVGGRLKIDFDPMYNADAFRLDSAFFRWAVKHAKLAVYPSSSAIYPVALQTAETHAALYEQFVHPDHPSWSAPDELYGFTKLAGEFMGWKAATKHGLPVLAIRPFSGYGPGQSMDYPIPAILRRILNHDDPVLIWGSGQTRDFVYVTDIVDATIARVEAGVDGFQTMNIGSGIGTSFEQIVTIASEIEGYHPGLVRDTGQPTGVMARRASVQLMNRYFELTVPLRDGLQWTMDSLRVKEPVGA